MKYTKILILFILSIFIFSSCSLINFEKLKITFYPSEKDQIIGPDENISISFSITPNERTVEKAFKLSNKNGTVSGDFIWNSNVVTFTPHESWRLGEIYYIDLEGEIHTDRDLEFMVNESTTFFVGSKNDPPSIILTTPLDEEIIDVVTPLVLEFNKPIDTESFRINFSMIPSTDYILTWNLDEDEVTITPDDKWEPSTRYNWKIADELLCNDGIYITEPTEGHFLSTLDSEVELPIETQVSTYDINTNTLVPISTDLNNTQNGHSILFTFLEDMDFISFRESFQIEPDIAGDFIQYSSTQFIFQPQDLFAPQTSYTITLDTKLKDTSANPILEDQTFDFTTTDIPYQTITSVTAGAVSIHPLPIGTVPTIDLIENTGVISQVFTIIFSEEITEPNNRLNLVNNDITLEGVHPIDLSPLSLQLVSWTNSNTLVLTFRNFIYSDDISANRSNYYRLTIKGGNNSTINSSGSYLEEDLNATFITEDTP